VNKTIKTWKGLVKEYKRCSEDVQQYFPHLSALLAEFPLDVCLSYVFARMELGQNMALYCGLRKIHKAESGLAHKAIDAFHITREGFREKFKIVFGVYPAKGAQADLDTASEVRDAVMHGKGATKAQMRNAIAAVLWYAEEMNEQVRKKAGFMPYCQDLRGFTGRGEALDKATTRWMLKGMGFELG